jgi:predicted CopG family antitoxin
MDTTKLTTISISRENYAILKSLGRTGDTFNDVLTRILEGVEIQDHE